MRGDGGVAGEERVVGVPKFHPWGKCTINRLHMYHKQFLGYISLSKTLQKQTAGRLFSEYRCHVLHKYLRRHKFNSNNQLRWFSFIIFCHVSIARFESGRKLETIIVLVYYSIAYTHHLNLLQFIRPQPIHQQHKP